MVTYTYDAWGNHTITDTSGFNLGKLNPFRYRSYFWDPEIGLYFLQSRYYDPETGRFISQDDVSYLDPETINGLNLYAYCGSNSINRIDPTGQKWWHWLVGGPIITALAVATVFTFGAAAPITGAAATFVISGLIATTGL